MNTSITNLKGRWISSELDKWWQDLSQNGIKGGESGLFNIDGFNPRPDQLVRIKIRGTQI